MSDDQQKTAGSAEIPTGGESAGAESQEAAVRGPPEHTGEMAENQDKKPDTAARLARRISDIEHLLIENEAHQMGYVFNKIPRPYYWQWKAEANDVTALLVILKHRAKRLRKAG